MGTETPEKNSQLISVLREGVSLIQMVLFKEVRATLIQKMSGEKPSNISMIAGSATNEIFGTPNPEQRFVTFREKNWGVIEQTLLSLKDDVPEICPEVSDALRVQTLCDHQTGEDSSQTLVRAQELGILVEDRDIPLPSVFMITVRDLGKKHNLVSPPVEISPEQDQSIVH